MIESKKSDLPKFKISILARSKKSDWTKSKKFNLLKFFAKASIGTEFLIFRVKKTFIYLQKTFIKALILKHFDPECHICIKTDALENAISRILSWMILDQPFFNHVVYKDSDFSKFEIC